LGIKVGARAAPRLKVVCPAGTSQGGPAGFPGYG